MYKTVETEIEFNKIQLTRNTNGFYYITYLKHEGNFIQEEKKVHTKRFNYLEDALRTFKEVSEELVKDERKRSNG